MVGGIGNYSSHVQAGESSRTAQLRAESSQNVQLETSGNSISDSDSYLTVLKDINSAIGRKLLSPDGKWLISCDSDQMLWMGPTGEGGALWEIGKTINNEWIEFSPNSEWLAWRSENGKIAYRRVEVSRKESATQFLERGDKKFTFSADSKFLFILPKECEYAQEQRRQQELAITQLYRECVEVNESIKSGAMPFMISREDYHSVAVPIAVVSQLTMAGAGLLAVGASLAAAPLVLTVAKTMFFSSFFVRSGASLGVVPAHFYNKWIANKTIDELQQKHNKLLEENNNRLEIEFLSLEESNIPTSNIKINAQYKVICMAFSEDRKFLFTVDEENAIRKWAIQTGAPEGTPIILDTPITGISPSPTGKWLALANADENGVSQIQIYSTSEKSKAISPFKLTSEKIIDCSFSRDGRWFAVLEKTDEIILFSTELERDQKIQNIFPGPIQAIYWPEEKDKLITVGEDNKLCIWEIVPAKGVSLLVKGISFELREIVNQNDELQNIMAMVNVNHPIKFHPADPFV